MPSRRPGYPAPFAIPLAGVVALALSLYVPQATALAFGSYRVDQRVNALTQQTTTNAFATQNAIGKAFVGATLSGVQASFDSGVSSGAISWVLEMLDLADYTGSNTGPVHIGFVNGTPANPTNAYNGASDVDWWYGPEPADMSSGVPTRQLTGSFAGGVLSSSGAHIRISWAFGQTWALSSVVLDAHSGSSSAVTSATAYGPPGFPASEHIDPVLQSMQSMNSGQLKGNVSAASLAAEPIPSSLTGSTCMQAYTAANTMLDVIVGGCTKLFQNQVNATQPDQSDPTAPAAGAGAPYTLVENASHAVTGCHDKNAATVTLATCLEAAAYSDYMTFTTDRVIGKTGQGITFTSTPPVHAAPGDAYDVNATGGGSGNLVSFSVDGASTPGTCTISANHVSFLASGHCVVYADQAGSSNYLVAGEASQSIPVAIPRESVTQATPRPPGSRATGPDPAPSPPARISNAGVPASPRIVGQPAKTESGWLTAQFSRLRL